MIKGKHGHKSTARIKEKKKYDGSRALCILHIQLIIPIMVIDFLVPNRGLFNLPSTFVVVVACIGIRLYSYITVVMCTSIFFFGLCVFSRFVFTFDVYVWVCPCVTFNSHICIRMYTLIHNKYIMCTYWIDRAGLEVRRLTRFSTIYDQQTRGGVD